MKIKENFKKILHLYLVYLYVLYIIGILNFIGFFIYAQVFNITENECKNYIIKHKNEIVSYKDNNFRIEKCNLNYYTNITLKFYPKDSSYYVIFWGNRNSILWNTRLDKHFYIDIRYNKYKNKNIEKDIEIYNILNKKL